MAAEVNEPAVSGHPSIESLTGRHVRLIDGYDPPRPRSLWWVYLLVTLALAGMGIGAAQALFVTHDLGKSITVEVCLAQHRVSVLDPVLSLSERERLQFAACVRDYSYSSGVVMLGGAVALPATAWLLMLCGGLVVRWRLRRGLAVVLTNQSARKAISRFEEWCDVWKLAGRRRPRLLLAVPGTPIGGAFTTGLPLARPLVVVPLSYAYVEPAQFDVVVLHELAHVRSRDLLWAASLWWTGWLSVPILLLAVVPILSQPQMLWTFYSTSLGMAVALSVGVLLLRAALLRSRELAADRFVIDVLGDAGALRTAFGQDVAVTPARVESTRRGGRVFDVGLISWLARVTRYARWLFSLHPTPSARVGAGPGASNRWEGGFAFTVTAGLVAMIIFQGVYFELLDLRGGPTENIPRLSMDIAFAVASLLWAAVVVPAWTRRGEVSSRAGSLVTWWGPWAGAIVSLVLGYYLRIPGTLSVAGLNLFAGHLSVVFPSLGIIAAGTSALATAVATRLAECPRPRAIRILGRTGAILAVAATLATTWSFTTIFLQMHLIASTAGERIILNSAGDDQVWRFGPLLLLVGLLIVVGTTRTPNRQAPARRNVWTGMLNRWRHLLFILAITVVGGVAAAFSWLFRARFGDSADTTFVFMTQRWWICAFAGWVVLVTSCLTVRQGQRNVNQDTQTTSRADFGENYDSQCRATTISSSVVGSRRIDRFVSLADLPTALLAGLVTTVLAGSLQFLIVAATGSNRSPHTFQLSLRLPIWLLFVMSVATLPWLLLGVSLTNRIRRNRRYGWNAGYLTLVAGITVGLFSLALVGGILSQITVAAHDYNQALHDYNQVVSGTRAAAQGSPATPLTLLTPARDSHHTADPGRPLNQAEITNVGANISSLLPNGAKIIDNSPDAPPDVIMPTACQVKSIADYTAEKARPRTATIKKTYRFPAPGTLFGAELILTVDSYATPQRDFTDEYEEATLCAHFRLLDKQADNGYLDGTFNEKTPPNLPYPSFRGNYVATGRYHSEPTISNLQYVSVLIGHNLVSAAILYRQPAGIPLPVFVKQDIEQLLVAVPATVIENLHSTPPR